MQVSGDRSGWTQKRGGSRDRQITDLNCHWDLCVVFKHIRRKHFFFIAWFGIGCDVQHLPPQLQSEPRHSTKGTEQDGTAIASNISLSIL